MMTSIGDLAMSFSNRLTNARIRGNLNTLAQELTSGRKSDLRSALAGDVAPVSMLKRSLSNLKAYGTATTEAALFTATAQSSLDKINGQIEALTSAAFAMDNSNDPALLAGFGKTANGRFETIIGALNTSVAGRNVFGGAAIGSPPVADAALLLDDLVAALPATPTVQDVLDTVDAYFAPGGGFENTRYLGSDTPVAGFRLSPEHAVGFTMDARDRSLGQAMAAAAKVALIDRGVLSDRPDLQTVLIGRAAEDLLSSSGGLTVAQAEVGTLEERIETARTRNSAESAATTLALGELVNADPYDTATELQSVQTQLETFYSVTARLSQLSLAGYLR